MANLILNGGGSSIEGRIERLQIQRSDGSIREDRIVNIHNTIVNTGLDSILTFGTFSADGTNNRTLNLNDANSRIYDENLWVRMTYFTKIGTDTNDTITQYDMTDLVQPYRNAGGISLSDSHYIPLKSTPSVRGTTKDSCIAGDIRSTHRITNNSLKVTEDGVRITEVGFFVAISDTPTVEFSKQQWERDESKVPMFSRIALGDNSVVLNNGERLVITYAITEYASNSSHKAVDSIGLVDADGNEIVVPDSTAEGEYHYGAIARIWAGDGRSGNPPFHCISTTSDSGYVEPNGSLLDTYDRTLWYYHRTYSIYGGECSYLTGSAAWYNTGAWNYVNFLLCGIDPTLIRSGSSGYRLPNYASTDSYKFPGICVDNLSLNSSLVARDDYNKMGHFGNGSNIPSSLGYSLNWSNVFQGCNAQSYSKNENRFSRDMIATIQTYMPYYENSSVTTLPSPNYTSPIYWLVIRGMIYRIGYFTTPGNIETFVPYPIKKKAGQILKITFRETISRHRADEET